MGGKGSAKEPARLVLTLAPKEEAFQLGKVRGKRGQADSQKRGARKLGEPVDGDEARMSQPKKKNWELERTVIEGGEVVMVDQTY